MVIVQILKANHGLCQFVRHREIKNNIYIELTYILEENKCVRCRINNLILSMIRNKTMSAVGGIELEKGKFSEEHI